MAHDLIASYEDVQEGMSTPYGIAHTTTLTLVPCGMENGKWKTENNNSSSLTLNPSLKDIVFTTAKRLSEDTPLLPTPEYLHQKRAFGIWSLPDTSNPRRQKVEELLNQYLNFYLRQREQHHWYGFWNYGDFMHQYDPARHEWKYDVGGFAWDNTELGSISWLWYSLVCAF